jgi:hypothetical protein
MSEIEAQEQEAPEAPEAAAEQSEDTPDVEGHIHLAGAAMSHFTESEDRQTKF